MVIVPSWGHPHTIVGASTYQRKVFFLSPRGVKREQLRLAAFALCVASHQRIPMREATRTASREETLTASRLKPVVRRFAPAGSTLVSMRDALSASLAGHAMSVTSDGMSFIGRNREFGGLLGGNVRSPPPLPPPPHPII